MRALSALVLALALVAPATARAERFAVGVALGTTHAETDADAGLNASSTSGLWLRYRLVPRLAAEISYGRIATDGDATIIRSLTVAARFAPTAWRGGTLRPIVLVGLGPDTTDDARSFFRAEVGAGLELDLGGQFVIGADLRLGERELAATEAQPGIDDRPNARIAADLTEGGYRSTQAYLGVRF
ncbi:MAG: outer membrane beta-barrel protein [Kofleriaceae bacterium]|jgi:hypothetical protein|nr:outer membrane beta-barrel protein [Kofleriaceae bacterium]MBP9172390.1 outer membrane beta-barrel protein [Kofleriaceae bacterium]MBP9861410.1 outer membrane beta-barrel protein [Kofleriaceae bacterium]